MLVVGVQRCGTTCTTIDQDLMKSAIQEVLSTNVFDKRYVKSLN